MSKQDVFQVIHNPMKLFFQYEVWCSGEVTEMYAGFVSTKVIARCVKSFHKEQKALDSIKYWQNVAAFKEQNNVI